MLYFNNVLLLAVCCSHLYLASSIKLLFCLFSASSIKIKWPETACFDRLSRLFAAWITTCHYQARPINLGKFQNPKKPRWVRWTFHGSIFKEFNKLIRQKNLKSNPREDLNVSLWSFFSSDRPSFLFWCSSNCLGTV